MNYRDRQGNTILSVWDTDEMLSSIYSSIPGRIVLKLVSIPNVSNIVRRLLDTKFSCRFIEIYNRFFKIDNDEYKKQKYKSFNDYFTRKVKYSCRPVTQDRNVLISPCDGKLRVYKISSQSRFSVKKSNYSLKTLLKDEKMSKRYEDGVCVIIRLALEDNHRYCYIDSGYKTSNRHINGRLYNVNAIVNDYKKVYRENAREYTLMDTENFGKVLQMEVGTLFVGKINNYHQRGYFRKGDEKGRFEFGGSTIILLFENGKVKIDEDLLENTEHNFETLVKMGEQIGITI
ncbi:phosphatidylserine decarboxylase [Parasporobacterium paucivorans]|uniref:Phosphatidylserine decarboxylase n=1 Tax=Parasporobacterium paucivorans DSM 15970 TaxID=1122934 RepID=A0A1M6A477_9FIRM|nr:phosphatidylserine decarboxylase [Parasporobacterium paucivorans]SHI31225.1 phosphatidylserine decarboxylase [Parasporobacterium paucivorans DSM 15970]